MNRRTEVVSKQPIEHIHLFDKFYCADGQVVLVVGIHKKRWWQFWKRHTLTVQLPML